MAFTGKDNIQEIKARLSIVDLARRYLDLRPMGNRLVAPCPFHQETKPSFSINESEGTFYCFGCQAAGDIFDFYSRINGSDFRDTLEALAEETGVVLKQYQGKDGENTTKQVSHKSEMLKMHEIATAHFQSNLQSHAIASKYIDGRDINVDVRERYSLGFSLDAWQSLTDVFKRSGFNLDVAVECGLVMKSKDGRYFDRFRNRLMFPIRDVNGRTIAFGGRVIPELDDGESAKYLNSNGTPIYKKSQQLFGLDVARRSVTSQKNILITEGYMDVLALYQFGYMNAVAVLGTSFPDEQVKRISELAKHVELLFDGDAPGREAAFKACGKLLVRGISCHVVLFPQGEDIDSLLKEQGKEVFENLRQQSIEGLNFCIQTLKQRSPKDAVEWARAFLEQIEMPELFQPTATKLASGLGIDEAELRLGVVTQKRSNAAKNTQGGQSSPRESTSNSPRKTRDAQILTVAARYPHRLISLQEMGADLLLESPKARHFWDKLSQYSVEEILVFLTDAEKLFWVQCRSADAPPLDNEEGELLAIQHLIKSIQKKSYASSVAAALSQGSNNYETQREYMRALIEAQGRNNVQ